MSIETPSTPTSNAELIREAFEALNRQDLEALKRFWTEDTLERFPDRTCHGRDEIADYFADAFKAVPDFHMEVESIVEQGDDVFVHWHLTGTHDGPLMGIEPTGKPIAIDGIDHFVVREGRVISNFVVFDQMQYGRQLGMMPADGSAGDRAMKAAFNARTKLAKRLAR